MPRIVKPHEERKQQLMTLAGELFLKRGFGNTAVSDIVERAGVAQGTFYYYFESKESVLEAILVGHIDSLYGRIQVRCEQGFRDAGHRLGMMLEAFVDFTQSEEAGIFRLLRSEELVVIAEHARKHWNGKLFPLLSAVIDQGMAEGTMHVEHRDETLVFFWKAFHTYCEGFFKEEAPGTLDVKRQLFEKMANVLLGMENWTFRQEHPARAALGLEMEV